MLAVEKKEEKKIPASTDRERINVESNVESSVSRGGEKSKSRFGCAPPEEPVREFHWTDLGNAKRIVSTFGQDLKYVKLWKKWLIWNGKFWEKDDTDKIYRYAKKTVSNIFHEVADEPDPERRKLFFRFGMQSENASRLAAMISLAKSEPGIAAKPDMFDSDNYLLNLENGTINLKTGKFRPHSQDDRITKIANVSYNPEAKCEKWRGFLDTIFGGNKNLIRFIQRAIGYSLTGSVEERCVFILHGNGANGKSTFLVTIQNLLGDYSQQMPTDTLLVKRNDSIPTDVARLQGVRLAVTSEIEEGRRFSESLLKHLTGGDKQTARFLHADFFDFFPICKIWLGTNHKPQIRGTDEGIWDRIRLIPFNVRIPKNEQDKQLAKKLEAEAPGILNWCLEGLKAWRQEGLIVPEEVSTAVAEYRIESDIIAAFLDEECTVLPTVQVLFGDLYSLYTAWCETSGEKVVTKKKFGKLLSERGIEAFSGPKNKAWRRGVALKNS